MIEYKKIYKSGLNKNNEDDIKFYKKANELSKDSINKFINSYDLAK